MAAHVVSSLGFAAVAPQRRQLHQCKVTKVIRSSSTSGAQHTRSSSSSVRRGVVRCAAAAGGAGAKGKEEEAFEGEMLANNAASLDGKLRTLVIGLRDPNGDGSLLHRKSSATVFKNKTWLDAFKIPGQHITITDVESGKSIRKPISVSPYHARSTAPNSDVSVVELLLDSASDEADENFFAASQPPMQLKVGAVKGAGFENVLFPEYNLASAIERGHCIVCVAGGSRGMGPLHAVLEWPPVASHADAHPVTLFYMRAGDAAGGMQSAAYIEEWDSWREGGVKVVPCYGSFEDGLFKVQEALAGGGSGGGKFGSVVGSDPKKVTVLMAGLSGEETKAMLQIFSAARQVPKQQILVMPDFAFRKSK